MMKRDLLRPLIFGGALALLALTTGCGDDESSFEPVLTNPALESCDSDRRPVVAVHGFLASGDTWAKFAKRFAANGYCADQVHAFDWNSVQLTGPQPFVALDAFIDEVLERTGADQVDLMGHSAGGGVGYSYLSNAERAAKVAHYAHVASTDREAVAGPDEAPADMINVYSSADTIVVVEPDGIPGAENVLLTEEDHYEVATSEASFEAIFRFFNDGEEAQDVDLSVADEDGVVTISGKALTLGENIPEAGATVEIWEVDSESGQRINETPAASLTVNELGYWGPFEASTDVNYELFIQPVSGGRPVHYYREPFLQDDHFVYLRTLPSTGLAAAFISSVTFNDASPTFVVFSASRGLKPGDSLTLDETVLSTEAVTDLDASTIAVFVYDAGGDGEGTGETIAAFESTPFLSALDLFVEADADSYAEIRFNDRRIALPLYPAESEGPVIAVFE